MQKVELRRGPSGELVMIDPDSPDRKHATTGYLAYSDCEKLAEGRFVPHEGKDGHELIWDLVTENKVCEVPIDSTEEEPGHYCELPAVTERDGVLVCEAHREADA